jgi:hypothetical protein
MPSVCRREYTGFSVDIARPVCRLFEGTAAGGQDFEATFADDD